MTEEKDKCCQEHEHDCDCGCHEEADYITLQFDDGEDVECEILGLFDYEGAEYIALLPEDGRAQFLDQMNHLGLPGVQVQAQPAVRCGITGIHMEVTQK